MRERKLFRQTLIDFVDRTGGPNTCWPWTGTIENGYGRVQQVLTYGSASERTRKKWRAHRAYLIFVKGCDVPDDAFVCHTCDNRPCCNPRHLVVADAAWNNADMRSKGRDRHPKGSNAGSSKLTEKKVSMMKRVLAAHMVSRPEARDRFNVAEATIRQIILGNTWKHVDPLGPIQTVVANRRPSPLAKKLRASIRKRGMKATSKRLGWDVIQLRYVAYPLSPGESYCTREGEL